MADADCMVYILEITWGTRMTPSDVKAQEKKEERRRKRKERKESNHESI